MEKIYLSIDLDYWNIFDSLDIKLFEEICKLPVSKKLVVEHHLLLPHINKFSKKFNTLINVDYHSDLASREWCSDGKEFDKLDLNEGTWGNFIKNSVGKIFIWSPPSRKICCRSNEGYCHGYGRPNPFHVQNSKTNSWKHTYIRTKKIPDLSKCVAVGITLSPGWTTDIVMNQFTKWYKKGTFNEGRNVMKILNRVKRTGSYYYA
jgi:hypothetical protein